MTDEVGLYDCLLFFFDFCAALLNEEGYKKLVRLIVCNAAISLGDDAS